MLNLPSKSTTDMVEDVGTTKRGSISRQRKLAIWEREHGRCMVCTIKLMPGQFIFEHVRPLALGGADADDNIRLTCKGCASEKTKADMAQITKAKRQKAAHLGLKQSKSPLPGGRNSKWKKKLDGTVVRREP
jgi:5-methylcytosine-specific restriction endonuclease McrA